MNSRDPELEETFEETRDVVRKIGEEIRTLSYLLHPPLLDESGLASAVRWYAEGFQKRSGIHLAVDIAPGLGRLSTEVETALFRVVQESLTNVHRYSGSPDAEIRIFADGGELRLEVMDHGKGIEAGTVRTSIDGMASLGVGIPGMRERLRQLAANWKVDFGRNGTRVLANVPLKQAEAEISVPGSGGTPRRRNRSLTPVRTRRERCAKAHSDRGRPRGDAARRAGPAGKSDEWAVCGEAFEGREAVVKSRELRPDLIIMDINMPG